MPHGPGFVVSQSFPGFTAVDFLEFFDGGAREGHSHIVSSIRPGS